jgi:tetratricopeptide (TPR) repeat protein
MASHIDVWVGDYEKAVLANASGHAADERYVAVTGHRKNMYLGYRMHNLHFLVWAAMIDGQYQTAKKFGEEISRQLSADVVSFQPKFFESFASTILHVYTRFGKWQEILDFPMPEDKDLWAVKVATRYYARGIAYASMGQIENARKEEALFLEAKKNPQLIERTLHNNTMLATPSYPGMLDVAEKMLRGEIEYREGNFHEAFKNLREAVKLDDALLYDEPWGWMQPTRHALGALLLEQNHIDEARQAFNEDLEKYPENLWALIGLHGCAKAEKNIDGCKKIEQRFKAVSGRSEVELKVACFCANQSKA